MKAREGTLMNTGVTTMHYPYATHRLNELLAEAARDRDLRFAAARTSASGRDTSTVVAFLRRITGARLILVGTWLTGRTEQPMATSH